MAISLNTEHKKLLIIFILFLKITFYS